MVDDNKIFDYIIYKFYRVPETILKIVNEIKFPSQFKRIYKQTICLPTEWLQALLLRTFKTKTEREKSFVFWFLEFLVRLPKFI